MTLGWRVHLLDLFVTGAFQLCPSEHDRGAELGKVKRNETCTIRVNTSPLLCANVRDFVYGHGGHVHIEACGGRESQLHSRLHFGDGGAGVGVHHETMHLHPALEAGAAGGGELEIVP